MFFVVIGIVLAVCAFVCQASTRYARKAVRNIPGPYCIPLLGCLHVAIGITPKNFHKKAEELQSQYGSVFRSWVFNRLFILSTDAELNEQLLTSTSLIKKMPMYGILQQWLGAGLLLSDGKKWHSRRKIITPAFHFNILEQFQEVFDRQSSILISCLAERADGQTAFDIHPYISAATLDVIAETAMGTKVNAQTDKSVLYTAAVKEMTDLMTWRYIRVHLNNEVVFSLLHPHKKLRQMKLISIMHDFTKNVIEERRKVLEKSVKNTPTSHGEQDDRDSGVGLRKRMALLDVLLQTSIDDQALSNADILEEVNTFMFAGHDTTASAISFTLHLLARDPRVQNKLWAEIRQVCGDNNATSFPLANLKDLKYLDCVIKESLRIYAPVPIIGREITEDFKYKHSRLGEGVIPAGTEFIAAIAQPSLEEQYFKNASDFFPERHESGDIKTGFTFIPFSAGPRNCIGQKFALSEMKVMLTQIVREYELLPLGADIEKMLSIVLSSRTGMQLGLRKRTID